MRRRIVIAAVALAVVAALVVLARHRRGRDHYTGFVEGEERVLRSEVTGRLLETACAEGRTLAPGATVAHLDDAEMAARVEAQRREVGVLAASVAAQAERVRLAEETWEHARDAQAAALAAAEAAARVAAQSFEREQALVRAGASTRQQLDDARAARDQTASAVAEARQRLAGAEAEERSVAVARHELAVLDAQQARARARLAEREVTLGKFTIPAPAVATVVQTQFLWPGELAQPGTPVCAVLDPTDTYVRVYVPVPERDRFRLGRPAAIELDSRPGERLRGTVSFVADETSFTPEKIETRGDRVGQVYRAKIRLDEPAAVAPGTEGNVWLLGDEAPPS